MSDLSQLARRFSVPGLSFELDGGRLCRAVIKTQVASGSLYLHGAHVTSWQPTDHEPVLWLSAKSCYEMDKPIRGGVPICFPWFGPHPTDKTAPAHGSARITEWSITEVSSDAAGAITIQLRTGIDQYLLSFSATFGRTLKLLLQAELPDTAAGPQQFEEALHTYLALSDIRRISISGLEGVSYRDKLLGGTLQRGGGVPIEFGGEMDRVYLDTQSSCVLMDNNLRRRISISKSGSDSTVVWNPWIEKSARMPDFGDDEWPGMVCIETANVDRNAVTLAPGESHAMSAEISVESTGC